MSQVKTILQAGRSLLLGLGSQVIAAAPIIVMSIYVSRAVGLAAVADFVSLIGISSVVFTLGMIGLRSRLVLDRFRNFAEADYYNLRIAATAVMAVVILVAGLAFGAPPMLTVAVALLRVGDAALDLAMAIDQVRRNPREHMYGYLNGSTFKLVMIVVFLGVAELTGLITPFSAYALASAVHAVYAWALLMKRREDRRPLMLASPLAEHLRLIRNAAVFAVAQILCALLTSAPRLALPGVADRELAGASAAALSVSTLIGMAYFAVWLRWVPYFGREGLQANQAGFFMLELTIALMLIQATLWLIGVPAMALIYAIDAPVYLNMALWTLFASAVFFYVMTLANLFKPTRMPWAESAVHLGGIAAIAITAQVLPGASIPMLLVAGTLGMVFLETLSLALLLRRYMGGGA